MTKLLPAEEQRLLVKISKMHYEEGLTQDAIMRRLGLSRSKVSRLLDQARREGIVQITVVTPRGSFADLEMGLEETFHLQEAVVVETHPDDTQETVNRQLGIAAAAYLHRTLEDGDSIGISWGSTLNYMVGALHPMNLPGAHVVQIIGGLGQPEAEVHAADLCRRMARALGCRLTLLPAPGIVQNQRAKDALQSEPFVQKARESFAGLDMAFVGIGAPTPHSVVMQDGAIITPDELDDLLQQDAVGDIALRFFDPSGQPVVSDIDERVIGITLEELSRVRRVVGVVGGPEKVKAVLGALRGRLVKVLITDAVTAQVLLHP